MDDLFLMSFVLINTYKVATYLIRGYVRKKKNKQVLDDS